LKQGIRGKGTAGGGKGGFIQMSSRDPHPPSPISCPQNAPLTTTCLFWPKARDISIFMSLTHFYVYYF